MSRSTADFGKRGEDLASEHLVKLGFEILHRNYRSGHNEVDIIARRGNTVSFVEVKARRSLKYGAAIEAVTPAKQREIVKVAEAYIAARAVEKTGETVDYRFDVITVFESAGKATVEFIEDAFRVF